MRLVLGLAVFYYFISNDTKADFMMARLHDAGKEMEGKIVLGILLRYNSEYTKNKHCVSFLND